MRYTTERYTTTIECDNEAEYQRVLEFLFKWGKELMQ